MTEANPIKKRRQGMLALYEPNYRVYIYALSSTWCSLQIQLITRGWIMLELTDSPLLVTMTQGSFFIPMLLLSLAGGLLADKYSRKLMIIYAELVVLILYILLAVLYRMDLLDPFLIIGITLASGIAFALSTSARNAMLPSVVSKEALRNGAALSTMSWTLSFLVAPSLAGYFISIFGESITLFISCGITAFGLTQWSRIQPKHGPWKSPAKASPLTTLIAGFRYVRVHSSIGALIILGGAVMMLSMPYQALLPVFARDVLGSNSSGLGLLMGATGFGALVGCVFCAMRNTPIILGKSLRRAALCYGFVLILFSQSPWIIVSALIAILVGLCQQTFISANFTLIQTNVPTEILGRVFSIRYMAFGMMPVGQVAVGYLAEIMSAPLATLLVGLLSIIAVVIILKVFSSLRRL